MDFRSVDLNLLYVLNVLFEELSVSRAAKRLGVSQPAVSASLARLRRHFDDQLFIRTANGLLPTAYAESLREAVAKSMELIDTEIFGSRPFEPSRAKRAFNITTSDLGEAVTFGSLLLQLLREAPECTLRSVPLPPSKLGKAMAHGEIDLAIGYFPDLDVNGFYCEHLRLEPLTCVLRRDHPIQTESISIEQFQSAPHLVVTHEERAQDQYERLIVENGITRNERARVGHFTNVAPLLATTDLIAIVPKCTIDLYSEHYRLRTARLPFAVPDLEVKQYWHCRTQRDSANVWLRRTVAAMFGNDLGSDAPAERDLGRHLDSPPSVANIKNC